MKEAGVDTGYSPEPGTLRAPDVAVGNVPDVPAWVPGAPELAIDYAHPGVRVNAEITSEIPHIDGGQSSGHSDPRQRSGTALPGRSGRRY